MLVSHEALHVQLLAAGSFGLCLLGAGLSLDTHEPMVTTCCKFKSLVMPLPRQLVFLGCLRRITISKHIINKWHIKVIRSYKRIL